jgi:hypothetical protein
LEDGMTKTLETFKISTLIEQLEKIRQKHGGDCPMLMVDTEPVVRVEAQVYDDCTVVYISDQ